MDTKKSTETNSERHYPVAPIEASVDSTDIVSETEDDSNGKNDATRESRKAYYAGDLGKAESRFNQDGGRHNIHFL